MTFQFSLSALTPNFGDIVLDPFCGCGTTIHAAQKLGRQWIGIDVTYLAINLIKNRLESAFGERAQFAERGQPTDFASAKALAELDKWQFEQWALSLVKTSSFKEGEGKGADRGVDGHIYFYDIADEGRSRREEAQTKKDGQSLVTSTPTKSKKEETLRRKILVQVKGGGVKRSDVATLLGDVNNQKFAGGVLITLEKPSKPMREEAADAGRYESKLWQNSYPKIQILTVEGLMNQTERLDAPPRTNPFAKAEIEAGEQPKQIGLIE